ncbi:MAG: helicase-related protein, partial [Pseudomonadota bacterium]
YCNFAMPGRPIPEKGDKSASYQYNTVKKSDIKKDVEYGEIVKETTINGVEYVEFKKKIMGAPKPSLGSNFKPLELLDKSEKGRKNALAIEGLEGLEEVEVGKEGLEEGDISNVLKEANKYEAAQDIDDEKEGEIEGDEILDTIGGISYKERIDAAIKYIWDNSNEFLTPTALETYSPKFLHILENIKDPKYLGLHLVYSQFRTLEGIGLFTLVLEKNGFTRFKIKKNSSNGWEMDIAPENQGKPTYGLYTGTESDEEKKIIKDIYNGDWDNVDTSISNNLRRIAHNNNMGEIIKVFMITSSGSEGINLRNTRYVHIMEPYWHPVRTEQVIGRARRICSHTKLPLALQTVEVFVYLMKLTKQQIDSDVELKRKDLSKTEPKVPVTSDQLLFEISEIKANLSKQLTDAIKESSFDCFIYSNGNCVNFGDPKSDKFAYVPDYEKQQNDTTVVTNKKTDEWTGKPISIAGVDYVYRRMARDVLNIYDKESYLKGNPVLIGTYETNEHGERVFKQIV